MSRMLNRFMPAAITDRLPISGSGEEHMLSTYSSPPSHYLSRLPHPFNRLINPLHQRTNVDRLP